MLSHIFSPPNTVSLLRLLIAPVAIWLAITGRDIAFLIAIALSIFTDLLDGFLARWLNQITPLGSLLDSWGDFTIYSTMAIGAFLLWPDQVYRHSLPLLTVILSFTLPTLIGLIKFHGLTSYHTWSVKLAVGSTVISYFLLFTHTASWPMACAAVLCLLAALEETAITLTLKEKRADVRSLLHAMR